MCHNYEQTLAQSLALAQQGKDWRRSLHDLLADSTGRYIQAAREVYQMLEHSKQLLEANAKAIFPK